jgi:hypothetical protein
LAERHPDGGYCLTEFGKQFMDRFHSLREQRSEQSSAPA